MSINKTKAIGIIFMVVGLFAWVYYTYNLLVAGGVIPNLLNLPLLNEFWIIGMPMFLLVSAVLALMIWLGLSTFTTPEPRVTDEELQKLEELERLARAKRMEKQKKAESA